MKKRPIRRTRSGISEARLREIIYEELVREYLVREGLWDDVKNGVKKLSAYISKQFKQVAGKWAAAISDKVSKLSVMPDEVKQIMGVLKEAMAKTGESFKLDEGLRAAQELGKLGADGAMAVVQQDLEGPVHEKAKSAEVKGEGKYLPEIYAVLSEDKYLKGPQQKLNEDFGITAALGVGLAVMGGLPLLFKGLHKLANALGATGTAELMHKAEKVTHHFEEKVVDFAMPFKLAYAVYLGLWKLGIKLTKGDEPLNEIEIKAEKEGIEAIKHAKGLIYKVLLIYLAINGLMGVLKAGASLLGFVEGGATTVKGIELARGAEEVAKLVRTAGAAAGAVAKV